MSIACPDCGTILQVAPLAPGELAICPRCENRLERTAGRSLDAGLACAAATFMLLFPANLLPLLGIQAAGFSRHSLLWSGVALLWTEQWWLLAVLIALFAIILPFVRFGLLALVLGLLRLGRAPPWLGAAYRWATRLDLWAMPDVFLIAGAIGYGRVEHYIPVRIDIGGWCLMAAAFLAMITRAAIDQRRVWRRIGPEIDVPAGTPAISCACCDLVQPAGAAGRRCPRCRARLFARKPDALTRTLAFAAAGILLYGPANAFPMTSLTSFGDVRTTRIYDGIEELIKAHLWPLAIIIFTTSIAIPFVKLAGLLWFCAAIRRRTLRGLIIRTKFYRFIDQIGRWSNIDPFTLAVFGPLMQFGDAARVDGGWGATAFILVVVVTMLASRAFDARLMWDAAEQPP